MKAHLLLLATLLLVVSPVSAHAFGKKPVQTPPTQPVTPPPVTPPPVTPPGVSGCPQPGAVQVVDLSLPVDQHFLDVMKAIKVNTVVRYYDQVNETLPGKTLKASEVDLLARNGFDVMVVFQHNNNNIASFTTARGISDSARSLSLAASYNQPKGSAIYFGVDGGWSASADLAAIKTYFTKASAAVRAAGYKVGVYGSGLTCTQLRSAGLVDYCWLANATGWPGYQTELAANDWVIRQKLPQDCGGKNVDFDVMNLAARDDMGQFRP